MNGLEVGLWLSVPVIRYGIGLVNVRALDVFLEWWCVLVNVTIRLVSEELLPS